jgi:death on curing protein
MRAEQPAFLSRAFVDQVHTRSLELFGGMVGVRDNGLVESALAAAENIWFYGGGDMFDIAAAYAFHLSQAQAFFDGNKRTAIASAFIFLEVNGVRVSSEHDGAIYDALIAIAERRMDKPQLAGLLRKLFAL